MSASEQINYIHVFQLPRFFLFKMEYGYQLMVTSVNVNACVHDVITMIPVNYVYVGKMFVVTVGKKQTRSFFIILSLFFFKMKKI